MSGLPAQQEVCFSLSLGPSPQLMLMLSLTVFLSHSQINKSLLEKKNKDPMGEAGRMEEA